MHGLAAMRRNLGGILKSSGNSGGNTTAVGNIRALMASRGNKGLGSPISVYFVKKVNIHPPRPASCGSFFT